METEEEFSQIIRRVRDEKLGRKSAVKFNERTDGVRDQRIPLRVNLAEKAYLIRQAEKRGITVSAFILLKALRGLKKSST